MHVNVAGFGIDHCSAGVYYLHENTPSAAAIQRIAGRMVGKALPLQANSSFCLIDCRKDCPAIARKQPEKWMWRRPSARSTVIAP
jgi:hypothetical protein